MSEIEALKAERDAWRADAERLFAVMDESVHNLSGAVRINDAICAHRDLVEKYPKEANRGSEP